MSFYAVDVVQKRDGLYVASCDSFDLPSVSASTALGAVSALRKSIERKGSDMLMAGESLPDEFVFEEGTYVLECDLMGTFKNSASDMVRRTVSLPKWLDVLIRNSEIDSSGVFREAVMKKLSPSDGSISTLDELKEKVDSNLLKAYVKDFIGSLQ